MSRLITFAVGLLTGAYVAQTYNIPKVNVMAKTIITKISEYEKKEK
tara:strand:+ start:494 stop:631 length:138 start_codon:yes stop_codon:yes gene_type:complete